MSWFYRHLLRPVLFTQDAEQIHDRMMRALGWAGRHELAASALETFFGAPDLPVDLLGLRFPNPVGLAAGMDKQAEALPIWRALGFGFTELGAVTWHAQPGNPAPRLFRAIADEAIINRMGFNNPGAEAVAEALAKWRAAGVWPRHPVGMNLGKSKVTPLAQAPEDYANSLRALWPHLDFFVVNVSSPNTPDLRRLQDKAALEAILEALDEVRSEKAGGENPKPEIRDPKEIRNPKFETRIARTKDSRTAVESEKSDAQANLQSLKPILVKVAPDLAFEALDEILELAGPRRVAGIVATNTTVTRPETKEASLQRVYAEAGGLSGRPLRARSTEIIRHLFRQTGGKLPIIGVGGIFTAAEAWEKIAAGASLVQVYTGMVFEGPGVAKAIVSGLQECLEQRGMRNLSEAVGSEAVAQS